MASEVRSHEVKQAYLRQHRGTTSYNIPERDVETWLSLKGPGVLWQMNASNKFGKQPSVEVEMDGENGSAQYKFPLRGGRYEATQPTADLFEAPDRLRSTPTSDDHADKGGLS